MDNLGEAPPDYGTDVGKMRLALGDTRYTLIGSGDPGKGVYEYFSDAELQAFLDMYDTFAEAVMGAALAQVSAQSNTDIRTDDLAIKENNQNHWLTVYGIWAERVANENSYVDVVYPEGRGRRWPEASPPPMPWARW